MAIDEVAMSPNCKDKIMMKNWLKRTVVGVAVTGALVGSVAAWSQGPAFHGAPPSAEKMAEHQARMLERITKRLKLDAGQQAKLQVLAAKLQAAHPAPPAMPARGASAPASERPDPHAKIEALLAGKTFDRAGAQADINARIAREQAEFTKRTNEIQANGPALIAAFGDFFDSLNPIQQQQVRDFISDHRGPGFLPGFGPGLGGGFGHGHGFGPEHRGEHRDQDDRGHGDRDHDRDGHGDHGDRQPPAPGN